MSGYESMFLCAVTWVAGGVGGGLAKAADGGQGLDQGPSGEAGPFTSARIKKGCVGSRGVGGLVCGR